MENPASVEFVEMKRADRKDALGKSIDNHLRLRQREKRFRRSYWRHAVSISRPRRQGVHRWYDGYDRVPVQQYLQLRSAVTLAVIGQSGEPIEQEQLYAQLRTRYQKRPRLSWFLKSADPLAGRKMQLPGRRVY